jgi:hypothetical protein
MKRNQLLLTVAAVLGGAVAGCGDNSRQCGPGTEDINGVCTGVGEVICTDGTKLNADGTGCEIDPAACQDGTVLIDGACVDPGHVDVNVEEAAEPNGLGLFGEVSADGAGNITLPSAANSTVVIHGKIIPFLEDSNGQPLPDVDSYIITADGPALIEVTADGLAGLAAGFVSLAAVDELDPLADWLRFGLNLTGDTSRRQLYIPAAGVYILAIADTRSLFLTGGAAGSDDPNRPFEYYVTIKTKTASPQALPVTDGFATSTGELEPGEVKLFTVEMGEGINSISLDAPAAQNIESLIVTNTHNNVTAFKAVVDGNTGAGTPANAFVVGIRNGDSSLVVADHVFNYALNNIDYNLIISLGEVGALSTDGGSVSQPTSDVDFTAFYYEVESDGEITGMDLAFDTPVVGVVVNEDFAIHAFFTFDPGRGFFFEDRFQQFRGLLRHQTAGRYYFLVFLAARQPNPPDEIVATSSYGPMIAEAITKGTPLNADVNEFASNPFTYMADRSTDAWQQFNAIGTGTGNLTAEYYDPNQAGRFQPGFGFGRLDGLRCSGCISQNNPNGLSECIVGGRDFCADKVPLFTTAHVEAGTVRGRILLDDPTDNYLLKVNTANGTGSFDLDFQRRAHTDLGTIAAGDTATADDQPLDATTTIQRYILRATAGDGLDIAVTPNNLIDTRLQRLNNDESARGALVNNGILGQPDTVQLLQSGEGWTAFQVTSLAPTAGGVFDLSVAAIAPVTYTAAAGTTTFSDACIGGGGAPLLVVQGDGDEGRSGNVNTPAGFAFFGFAAPQIRVFTNGFASVDTTLQCSGLCFFQNFNIPNVSNPNGFMAPFWDDLDLIPTGPTDLTSGMCQKVDGTKLIIQWRGQVFSSSGPGEPIAFQLILDGADDSIEFVYDSTHVPTGGAATIGLENQVGSAGNLIGFNTANSITPGTSIRFTPN